MASKKNPCIYTGRVGRPMRAPAARRAPRRWPRANFAASGGPLGGGRVRCSSSPFTGTLTFSLHGQVGRYLADGQWEPQEILARPC